MYAPDNAGGFRVRLGEEGSENFVYEINKDGVREEKFEDTDKLKELINKTKEYHKQLEENAKSDEDKEKVQKAIKEFNERFNSEIKDIKRVVFYGKKVEEEKDEKEEEKNQQYKWGVMDTKLDNVIRDVNKILDKLDTTDKETTAKIKEAISEHERRFHNK